VVLPTDVPLRYRPYPLRRRAVLAVHLSEIDVCVEPVTESALGALGPDVLDLAAPAAGPTIAAMAMSAVKSATLRGKLFAASFIGVILLVFARCLEGPCSWRRPDAYRLPGLRP
jgi:hypothetical protein